MSGVYLHDLPLEKAWSLFREALNEAGLWQVLGKERLPIHESLCGRVLAESVMAKTSNPHYHASAMDGFAVRSGDTATALPSAPVMLRLSKETMYVDTGDPVPAWCDAVIPIENVEPIDTRNQPAFDPRQPDKIRIRSAVTPWKNIRPYGEDIVVSELILPAGQTLRPVDLGAALAGGNTELVVSRKPRVAVLPTGSELVSPGELLSTGKIIEFNSLMLAAQVNEWGGDARRYPITADDPLEIKKTVLEAAQENDLILLNAGSSAGAEDYSAQVVTALGKLFVHGVAVRPGHPVILGMIQSDDRKVPVIGVPGFPVSAALTGEIFVEPLLATWCGRRAVEPDALEATLTRKVTSPAGDDEYLRVVVGIVGEKTLATPIQRGAGVISSLVKADGIVILPAGVQGLPAGEKVTVRLYRKKSEVQKTILAIGSHDIIIDLIAEKLYRLNRRLISANVGSQGGLMAVRRGDTHLAGSHLLDTETGQYNISYVQRYIPNEKVMLVHLVRREQGLVVMPGNPKGIHSLKDLARSEVSFINRQRGSGTRLLLEYHLSLQGIDPGEIQGYDVDEYTHLAVAAAVRSGRADCGLGIRAAAEALGLEFIHLFDEQYDLVMPLRYYESDLLAPLLGLLKEPAFKAEVEKLPGYQAAEMGVIAAMLET